MLFEYLITALTLSSMTAFASPVEGSQKLESRPPKCRDVIFRATASAKVFDLSPWSVDILLNTSISSLFGNGSTLNFDFPASGTFNIAGRYCEPHLNSRDDHGHGSKDIIQILVHGSSYTSKYWSGIGSADNDWSRNANNAGYATLAIDRLGRGKSSRPDPKLFVQYSFEVELIHQIIDQIRSGQSSLGSHRFKKIVYVGNAYGSIIGANLAAHHPNDFDALVLTSYSSFYNVKVFGDDPIGNFVGNAAVVDPTRFSGYDEGYTLFRTIDILRSLFYYPGGYSNRILAEDFQTRGVIPVGEIATAAFGLTGAEFYQGDVLIADGKHDLIFCGTGPLGSTADCGGVTEGPVANTREQFPSAKSFEAYFVPNENTASAWVNQYLAPEGIKYVLAWLDEKV